MVHPFSASFFVIALTISLVKATDFSFCANYIFTSAFYDHSKAGFKSQLSDNNYFGTLQPQTDAVVSPAVSCSSTYMNEYQWSLSGSYSGCTSLDQFGLGFWVNFETTKCGRIYDFIIGTQYGYANSYHWYSETDGTLTFIYFQQSGASDRNPFSITVPLSNFYLDEWTFLTLHWIGSTFNIFIPGQAKISKTSSVSYPFSAPSSGYISFGSIIKVHIYQIVGFNSATINDDNSVISLFDGSSSYAATGTCSVSCTDPFCHPTQICLATTSDCTSCDSTGCLACAVNTLFTLTYCNKACPLNCAKCTSDFLTCIQCKPGYFLYDNAGKTTCVSCAASCSSCTPGPACFKCAEAISQDGSSCSVSSIGYQLSFASPNIEIGFAHPLGNALTIDALQVSSNQGAPIDTTKWILQPCTAGLSQCTIWTDNLSLSQLPADITFKFNQGA